MSYTTKRTLRTHDRRRQISEDRIRGAIRGVLVELSPAGEPFIDYCGNPAAQPLDAISTVPLHRDDIGREAILLFEDGDPLRPLLVGIVQSSAAAGTGRPEPVDATLDGRKITLTAREEITLQCGDASITLTRAGKVLIRGSYLLSRSTGPNRIKGGSVQLN